MLWTLNLAMKHLHILFPAICSTPANVLLLSNLLQAPFTLQKAFSLVTGDGVLPFAHWDIAGNLGIASRLLKTVVVAKKNACCGKLFHYYLLYIQIWVVARWSLQCQGIP
jgi:hypothetical protein